MVICAFVSTQEAKRARAYSMVFPMPEAKRRLATVLAADFVAFSRRMGENEESTVAALTECRALLSALIKKFDGETVGMPGDFLLALMPSGAHAIECAIEIQAKLAERNLEVDEARRTEYRI